ncbi:chemotaxis protein MotC [Lichenihabitans sp. Uapishka_5]|uniref:chemotaxis protein MotC n=1 Tax=Lichenihabitans sp. Uapishka_5 TaxID=3037302 RepID=UPI0029E80AD6|nr:chemotaxis protein MotC [Lichenihabitans sp. Uapishka_5]MDX7953998.1 chemotaxis protein MotC [Lichenihabitans sp. Uapishka_5]
MIARFRPILAAAVLWGAASAAVLVATPAARADQTSSSPNAPYAQMRTLQTLQEQIAHGNAAAQAAQPKLMAHIADMFLSAEPEAWADPRNGRAAALFILSGGKPEVVRTVLERAKPTPAIDRLLKGALAYGEGEESIAAALLEPIDPKSVPNALGGHLALVKASLVVGRDPAKADKLLDLARLLMPGTLVEEAALRRQIFLLADSNQLDKVTLLSRQYLHRFRTSVYAENFRERFAVAVLRFAAAGDTPQLTKFDAVIKEMRPDEARRFYLAMAKAAITNGRTATARMAADKAKALAVAGSPDAARADLYTAAALVASDRVDDGMTRLTLMNPAQLGPDDVKLRQAALSVGTVVSAQNTSDGAGDEAGGTDDPGAQLLARAHTALQTSDQVLKGAGK